MSATTAMRISAQATSRAHSGKARGGIGSPASLRSPGLALVIEQAALAATAALLLAALLGGPRVDAGPGPAEPAPEPAPAPSLSLQP